MSKAKPLVPLAISIALLLGGLSCGGRQIPEAPTKVADKDYVKTESGLKYFDLAEGDGPTPKQKQTVFVHYTGWLADGKMFDSSLTRGRAFSFVMGMGAVIAGWDEGVATMRVGGKRQLVIPPELGYGKAGIQGRIPPNATLVFEIDLLDFE